MGKLLEDRLASLGAPPSLCQGMGLWLGRLWQVFWLGFRGDLCQFGEGFVVGRDYLAAFWTDVINLTHSTILPLRYAINNGTGQG